MRAKIPRWGWVTALPHEYLVQIRRGEVIRGQQGGSCFKWPSDTVALVDTSLRQLRFVADQVTREKAGVQVTGFAVLRVVEPTLAYRMLDLSDGESHVDILEQMLLGATRRLVANLTLEDCLTRRKDALAAELLAEIAPVVGGSGRGEDGTDRGWGLAIDTIEIQDVRVLSAEVFAHLQAAYREELARGALSARDELGREEARLRHEAEQAAERNHQARLGLEAVRRETERAAALIGAEHAAELRRREVEVELALDRRRVQHEIEQQQLRTEAAIADEQQRAEARRAVAIADAEAEREVALRRAEAERALGEARAEVERLERAARDSVSEARLREVLLTDTLPEVARAYADSFDRIVVTGASDLSVLGQGVSTVLATAKALGWALEGSVPPGDPRDSEA